MRLTTIALQAGVALAVVLAAYSTSLLALADVWNQRITYSHGPLLAAVSAVLLVHSLRTCPIVQLRQGWPSLVLLGAGVTVWFLARATTVQFVELLATLLVIWGAIGTIFGIAGLKRAAFPLGLLLWTVPVWDYATSPAQVATVWSVSQMLWVTHVSALVDGNVVSVPAGQFEIASGCSGIHYLIITTALGAMYSYLHIATWARRIACMVLSVAFAVVMNWIRVYTIVVAGYLTDMQHYLVTVDHYWYGWFLFLFMLLPLFYSFNAIARTEGDRAVPADAPCAEVVAGRTVERAVTLVCAVTVALLGPGAYAYAVSRVEAGSTPGIALPANLAGFRLDADRSPAWSPHYPGNDRQITGTYVRDNVAINAYENIYLRQSQGAELINSENRFFPATDVEVSHQAIPITAANGDEWTISEAQYRASDVRSVVLYAYIVGDRVLHTSTQVRIRQLDRFLRGRSAGGVVAVSIACVADCRDEQGQLKDVMSDLLVQSMHYSDEQ